MIDFFLILRGGVDLPDADHIGYLTRDIEKSAALFKTLGFCPVTPKIADDLAPDDAPNTRPRNVDLCFLSNGSYTVELVSPRAEDSVVGKMLEKQGEGPYHLCYRVADLEGFAAKMQREHWILVQKPAKAVAFGGRRVSFLFKKYIGLVELVEKGGTDQYD